MSARRQIIAALSEDSMGGIATLQDVARAEQLVNDHAAEVITALAEEAERRLSVGRSRTVGKDAVLRFLRLEASVARATATREKSSPAGADATPEPEPYTDSETAFMQIGTAQWPRRAVLQLDGMPPLVGTYNGAGMRRLDHHDGLIVEPMLAFADRPETTRKDGRS